VFRHALIRQLREEQGLKPEELALAIDRGTASLALYETGRLTPRIVVLERIAAALDESVQNFFEDEPTETQVSDGTDAGNDLIPGRGAS
jgi:transcriptional regulator with XRE-family HTH domain